MTTDQKAPEPQTVTQTANVPQTADKAQQSSETSGWVLDVLKTLIGAFAGAGLAFAANHISQRRIEKRANLTAGRLALFKIRAQWDDFANFRRGIFLAIANQYKQLDKDTPEWTLAKPIAFDFRQSNAFNFESLGFLLSTPSGRMAFQRLQFLERTYFDLAARHTDFNASVQELQRSVAALQMKVADPQKLSFKDIEAYAGAELLARVTDHQRGIVLRADLDENRYIKALASLTEAMDERFGDEATMAKFQLPAGFKKEDLPPLPPLLRAYVDSIPAAQP